MNQFYIHFFLVHFKGAGRGRELNTAADPYSRDFSQGSLKVVTV